MSRKPEIDRPVALHTTLPSSLRGRLDLLLFSELEGRVPKGAYQDFILARLRDFFDTKELDLAPYLVGVAPGTFVIRGTPAALEALLRRLSR